MQDTILLTREQYPKIWHFLEGMRLSGLSLHFSETGIKNLSGRFGMSSDMFALILTQYRREAGYND